MFERFTHRARQAVVFAQDEARVLQHNYIGTEHLLLGVLREEEGVGARVLESLGITVEDVRAHVVRIVGLGEIVRTGQVPFTPRAKKILELAAREALSLGHEWVGTEHILLGLVREDEGVAARILLEHDLDAETVRDRVSQFLDTQPPGDSGVALERSEPTIWFDDRVERQSPHELWRSLAVAGPMLVGAFLFGVGLLVGWLVWG